MRVREVLSPKRGGDTLNKAREQQRDWCTRHQSRELFGYIRAVLSNVLFLYLLMIKHHARKKQLDT